MNSDFFEDSLVKTDPEIALLLDKELLRQNNQINLIASENIVSKAVLDSLANVTTNKYAEGYPGKRYYAGCQFVDGIENLAIDRAKKLFKCEFANVQPNSGCQANQAVFLAFVKPGDTILGMDLSAGGHLTHGAGASLSGKWFNAISYGVNQQTGLIDYDVVADLAKQHKPKLIIAGASAYSRFIDFKLFKDIAKSAEAILLADVAHYSGLIVAEQYPSPFPHADVVTTTTHKTLRGPRGGMILTNDPAYAKKINSAVFPGLQGGPIMNIITAKAVAFKEALQLDFTQYAKAVINNARMLSSVITSRGYKVVTGGTDCHMALLDLSFEGITGKEAEEALTSASIICNKNTVPGETLSPFITSGIRIGSPTCTTRGFSAKEFEEVGHLICDVLKSLKLGTIADVRASILKKVALLCRDFPIYNVA
jgi:glycine hydroxymethyltransferase